jgi:hypothetical protein
MLLEPIAEQGSRLQGSSTIVRQEEKVARILQPKLNVCVWRRALPRTLNVWLLQLAQTTEFGTALRLSRDDGDVRGLFAGLPPGEELRSWMVDVGRLAALFARITNAPTVDASLATVDTNKCRKFHADFKALRLVCTYAGPGTEWVDDRDVNRSALGHEESCFETANARIVPRGRAIRTSGPGDVVLLKGDRFPGNEGRGAVHRSPPIETTKERRIVLTLDTP